MLVPVWPAGDVVAVNEPVTFEWDSDLSSLALYIVEARPATSPTWDEVASTRNLSATVAADTFVRDDYEWRVGSLLPTTFPAATLYPAATLHPTYQQRPEVDWSLSEWFLGRVRPDPPTIITPATDGETISQSRYTVEWASTHAEPQQRFQFQRRLGDGTVRSDTGEVISAVASHETRFQTTEAYRDLVVKVQHDGLWSGWSAPRRVYVFFIGPPTPSLSVTPDSGEGRIVVVIVNPAPGAQQPDLDVNEVWRRVTADGGDGIRRAVVGSGATFEDYLVASGVDYEYQVVALGADGNPTFTDWQE